MSLQRIKFGFRLCFMTRSAMALLHELCGKRSLLKQLIGSEDLLCAQPEMQPRDYRSQDAVRGRIPVSVECWELQSAAQLSARPCDLCVIPEEAAKGVFPLDKLRARMSLQVNRAQGPTCRGLW